MKTGWLTRSLCIITLLIMLQVPAFPQYVPSIKVTRLDTDESWARSQITPGEIGHEFTIFTHQVVGIQFIANFKSDPSAIKNWKAEFVKWWEYYYKKWPDCVEFWEDKSTVLAPGTDAQLTNVVFVRPLEAGDYKFKVTAKLRKAEKPSDPDYQKQLVTHYTIIVHVENLNEARYPIPQIVNLDTSSFNTNRNLKYYSKGQSNQIQWQPVQENNPDLVVQDIYAFDVLDRENLIRSVQGIYKTISTDQARSAFFNELLDGRQYGYFTKIVYENSNMKLDLFSPIYYSIQDNSPPQKIAEVNALRIAGTDSVVVWWERVMDELSGTKGYRIFRSIDAGIEQPIATLNEDRVELKQWYEKLNDKGDIYYRIESFDSVGNSSWSERSNIIHYDSNSDDGWMLDQGDKQNRRSLQLSDEPYIKGYEHRIWMDLDPGDIEIAVQWVRDDESFFNNPPSIPMRFFNSGWLNRETFRDSGWVSPGQPSRVYFPVNFAKSENSDLIDLNFVNGHTYYFRIFRKNVLGQVRSLIPDDVKVIPDCFPPTDIRNLKMINVADAENPDQWKIQVFWDAAIDDVSGINYYILYEGNEENGSIIYRSLLDSIPVDPNQCTFTYTSAMIEDLANNEVLNPVNYYKVTGVDRMGNERTSDQTSWNVSARSLWAPRPTLVENAEQFILEEAVVIRTDSVVFTLSDSHVINEEILEPDKPFRVKVDKIFSSYRFNPADRTLTIHFPDPLSYRFSVEVQFVYRGNLFSLWSDPITVTRSIGPPRLLEVTNVPFISLSESNFEWEGNIYLKWVRSTLNTKKYIVFRSDGADFQIADSLVFSNKDTVIWVDRYGFNELSRTPGDTLQAYQNYTYRISMINDQNEISASSNEHTTFCNRSAVITSSRIRNSGDLRVIEIDWDHVIPTRGTSGWTTDVRIYFDTLSIDPLFEKTISDTSTYFAFEGAEVGHTYIFRLKENPDEVNGISNSTKTFTSAWSEPYRVSLQMLMLDVVPQPLGDIFIIWSPSLLKKQEASKFEIYRDDSVIDIIPSGSDSSFMDTRIHLEHGREYTYRILALDDLGYIVAENEKQVYCDKGAAYIPELIAFPSFIGTNPMRVRWTWYDIEGNVISSTRGAESCSLIVSISPEFPLDTLRSSVIRRFLVNENKKDTLVTIPPLVREKENTTLFAKITAWDHYGNPASLLWDIDFYSMKSTVYDTIPPRSVMDARLDSILAYPLASDSVMASLSWSGAGVEWPSDSLDYWNHLLSNLSHYCIVRENATGIDTVGKISLNHENYIFTDIMKNEPCGWRIVSVDIAGNITSSVTLQNTFYLATPPVPTPIGYKSCSLPPANDLWKEYFVEIAVDPPNFNTAYEIEDGRYLDRLICRSNWIINENFICTTGWSSIQVDTTWFRIKARTSSVRESGWTKPVFYHVSEEEMTRDAESMYLETPKKFDIGQNYPNPFNSYTKIPYQLPTSGNIRITLYDILGLSVKKWQPEIKASGHHTIEWDGRDDSGIEAATGIYLVKMIFNTDSGEVLQKIVKLTLMK